MVTVDLAMLRSGTSSNAGYTGADIAAVVTTAIGIKFGGVGIANRLIIISVVATVVTAVI